MTQEKTQGGDGRLPAAHTLLQGVFTTSTVSPALFVGDYSAASIVLHVSASGGTNETLVPEVEMSPNGRRWGHLRTIIDTETEGDLTRLTVPTVEGKILAAGTFSVLIPNLLTKYIRLNLTLGGTSPTFTLKAVAFLR